MLYHFRQIIGDERVLIHGPFARTRRFWAGQRQFEELDSAALEEYDVIQGHGVDETTLMTSFGQSAKLFVLLRHPVAHVRSRYNHQFNALAAFGRKLSTADFMRSETENTVATYLVNRFPHFIPEGVTDLFGQAMSVLSAFEYVLTTESMNTQAARVFGPAGFDRPIERRRVADKKVRLDVSDQEILDRHPVDLELFRRFDYLVSSDGTSHNAAGFSVVAKQEGLEHLSRATRVDVDWIEELAIALCASGEAEKALARIKNAPESIRVPDIEGLRLHVLRILREGIILPGGRYVPQAAQHPG